MYLCFSPLLLPSRFLCTPPPPDFIFIQLRFLLQPLLPIHSEIYSAQYFKHPLLSPFFLSHLYLPFRVSRTERKATGTIGMPTFLFDKSFCRHSFFSILHALLDLFTCKMSHIFVTLYKSPVHVYSYPAIKEPREFMWCVKSQPRE
jgi:hypothetical protein